MPINHKYKKNIKDFFVGRVERSVASPISSGEELYDVVSQYKGIVFSFQSDKQKFLDFAVNHNWVTPSIFWELPCWKTNLFCYNLDVMHIKKNVFKNIFNMVMDMKEKTKNNMKAIIDIPLFCHRKNMKLVYNESRVIKPKASFTLDKNAKLFFYQWIKDLRFSK